MCLGGGSAGGGEVKEVVCEKGVSGKFCVSGCGVQVFDFCLGGFHFGSGDADFLRDLEGGEMLSGGEVGGDWWEEGGGVDSGLFFGVCAFFWGVLSTALSCRSCWTAPGEGGGKL